MREITGLTYIVIGYEVVPTQMTVNILADAIEELQHEVAALKETSKTHTEVTK